MNYKKGQCYRVPCVKIRKDNGKIEWVPVVGEAHSDPQFGRHAVFNHFHVDARFVNITYVANISKSGTTHHVVYQDHPDLDYKVLDFRPRLRRCHRLVSALLIRDYNYESTPALYMLWLKTMLGKKCKGTRCPHRGTEMIEVKGGLKVCPMHNLVACSKSEKIIGAYDGNGQVKRETLLT